jgi:hypothetical protein
MTLMLHERLLLLVLDDEKGKSSVGFADKARAPNWVRPSARRSRRRKTP